MSLDLHLEQLFTQPAPAVFDCIARGQFFALTGATTVDLDFIPGARFTLTFAGRGVIWGELVRIERPSLVVWSWNVDGFRPVPDIDTQVAIRIVDTQDGCRLTLDHVGIPTPESAAGKRESWTELLAEQAAILQRVDL